MSSNLVTLAETKDYLQINSNTYDSKLSNIITYVSGLVESYCSRQFSASNVTYEYQDGGYSFVFIKNPPINNVWSVAEYNGIEYVPLLDPPSDGGLPNVASNTSASPEYSWDSSTGKISKGFTTTISSSVVGTPGFANYRQGVKISYNGGYTTIPGDLKLVTLDLIKSVNKGLDAQITRFDREQIQQMPYSGGFPPHIRRVLDLYRIL